MIGKARMFLLKDFDVWFYNIIADLSKKFESADWKPKKDKT